ncbi:MAG: hypothetical protein WD794_02060 [Mycobacteriales bacterium]
MGSGLILLVIVGAWLVVLVPMALRSYDGSGSAGTVDKFHDAMRVLARRDTGASAGEGADDPSPRPPGGGSPAPVPPRNRADPAASPVVRPVRAAAAARRRRLLVALLVLSVATLIGGLLGPLWLLAPHLLLDLLLGALLVHLRRAALARAERDWRVAMQARPVARPAAQPAGQPLARPAAPPVARPAYVAGVLDRMPSRAVLLGLPAGVLRRELPAPAAAARPAHVAAPASRGVPPAGRDEDLGAGPRVRGAQGAPWSPVPVPAPIYLSAPTARRAASGSTSRADAGRLADAERDLGIVDGGPALDEILDRRRAVND